MFYISFLKIDIYIYTGCGDTAHFMESLVGVQREFCLLEQVRANFPDRGSDQTSRVSHRQDIQVKYQVLLNAKSKSCLMQKKTSDGMLWCYLRIYIYINKSMCSGRYNVTT